jgi:hypothetical protein
LVLESYSVLALPGGTGLEHVFVKHLEAIRGPAVCLPGRRWHSLLNQPAPMPRHPVGKARRLVQNSACKKCRE